SGDKKVSDKAADTKDGKKEESKDAGKSGEGKDAAGKDAAAKEAESKDAGKDKSSAGAEQKSASQKPGINVVFVADVDLLASLFFDSRARHSPDNELQIDTDNVTFVLNALDVLAGDPSLVDLRNKRPLHRPLEEIVKQTKEAREKTEAARAEFMKKSEEQEAKA